MKNKTAAAPKKVSRLVQAYESNKKYKSPLLNDVPGLATALTGDAILRSLLTNALNKSALVSGAVVQLKSGGPHMTVASVVKDGLSEFKGMLKCQWFDVDGQLSKNFFVPEALQLAKSS
jgi:uncharacterized protein YodC (DUF2158 family)